MTRNDGFELTVSDWLDEQAGHGMPGYLDEVLAVTTGTRQRPWWASLERWLPMQSTLRFAPAPKIAWLLVVIALIAALATALLSFAFSPDGTKVIARYPSEAAVWVLPVDGSAGSTLPWDEVDLPSMQRLAP